MIAPAYVAARLKTSEPIRNAVGRPSKASEAVVHGILKLLEAGVPKAIAARSVGVHPSTLHRWETADTELSAALSRAHAQGAVNLHLRVLQGGKGSAAAQWILETRFPQYYGKPARLEHSATSSSSIFKTSLAEMSDEELAALIDTQTE